jgi:hypothetical protein
MHDFVHAQGHFLAAVDLYADSDAVLGAEG